MRVSTAIITCASFVGFAQAVLDSYPIFNGGDAYWISKLRDLPVPNRWVIKRPWGTAPQHCVATAINNNFCNPYDLEIYDLYYADCNAPWTVCRCNTAPAAFNIDVIADNIGKIPVRARSWVRHYSFYPAVNTGYAAYSTSSDINVFGDFAVSTILFHETGHNLDWWVAGQGAGPYSNGQVWQTLAAKDTCVPTQYSKASWQEHFAEMSVQATYEENYGGIPLGTQCMANTLTQARSILRGAIKITGEKCVDRLAPSTNICMGPVSRAQGLCNDVLDLSAISKRGLQSDPVPVTEGVTYHDASVTDDLPIVVRTIEAQKRFEAQLDEKLTGAFKRRSSIRSRR